MKKDIIFGEKARKSLLKGIEKTYLSVGATLGPKGQNVLIDSGHPFAPSTITKDGVTVLRNLKLNDEVQNLAVKIIREASEKTVEECGDGTTTTAILACSIYKNGLKFIANGANPILIKKGIDKLAKLLEEKLNEIKIEVTTDEQIRNIATISANGDEEIGSIILQAIDKVGKDGFVAVERGKSMKDELEYTQGYKIEKGYVSPYFITNQEKGIVELDNPLIFIADYEFQTADDVVPLLEIAHSENRPLLIISEGGSFEALQTLIINKMKGVVKVCAVEAPSFGDRRKSILKDIAIATGANLFSTDLGMKINQITKNDFGSAEKAIISKLETKLINTRGDKAEIEKRVSELKTEMENETNDYDREFLKERIAKLTGGLAVIRVGGTSETEVEEKKDRIDDALGATYSALEDGIVIGGGCALIHCAERINPKELNIKHPDEHIGVQILLEAIKEPLNKIVENGGKNGEYIINKIIEEISKDEEKNGRFGYNALVDEFGDLIEMGVIDPVKVTKSALKNSVSVASLLLSSNVILMKEGNK